MFYNFKEHTIAIRDCCDIVRDKLEDEYNYDEVAKPVAYIVGSLMYRLYFRSDNGLVDYDEYENQITESTIIEGIKNDIKIDKDIYSEDDIEDIAEKTVEAFQSWYSG